MDAFRLAHARGHVLSVPAHVDFGTRVEALAAIGGQLEAVRQTLAARGIETGSALAMRLFS